MDRDGIGPINATHGPDQPGKGRQIGEFQRHREWQYARRPDTHNAEALILAALALKVIAQAPDEFEGQW